MSWLVLIHCCHIRQIDNKSRSLLVTDNPKELLCQILCVEFKLQVKFSILESICIDLTGHLKISKWTSRSKSQALIWEWWGMSCNNLYKKIKFLFPSFYPSLCLSFSPTTTVWYTLFVYRWHAWVVELSVHATPDAKIRLRFQNLNKFKSMNSIYLGDKEDSGKLGIFIGYTRQLLSQELKL